jgi:hypothetical protein
MVRRAPHPRPPLPNVGEGPGARGNEGGEDQGTAMGRTIRITAGNVAATAELNGSETASAIWEALPISARASTWGDEIYFAISVHLDEENAQATVAVGDLGYWPPGNAFCIYFGPTPASRAPGEIRPASPVNVFGTVQGDPTRFKQVRSGETVTIVRVES